MSDYDLEAEALGLYLPNRFLIRLGPDLRYPGRSAVEEAVFVHEYWHYLHNVSTVAGVDSFRSFQALVALFSHTMSKDADGTSLGRGALSQSDAAQMVGVVQRMRLVAGDRGPIGRLRDPVLTGRVTAIAQDTISFEVSRRGAVLGNDSMRLGSIAIEESIAHLIEDRFVDLEGEVPLPLSEFPYRVLDRVLEFALGSPCADSIVRAGLGTLALLTDRPGLHLPRLADRFRALVGAGLCEQEALFSLAIEESPKIRSMCQHLVELADELVQMHAGRGLLEGAIRLVCSDYTYGLQRRMDDPLFDIRPLIDAGADADRFAAAVLALQRDYPPCDILRTVDTAAGAQREVATCRNEQDALGFEPSQYLRSLQCQSEHMSAHLAKDLSPSSKLPPVACPFVEACPHPQRLANPDGCASAPWLHLRSNQPGCWYTSGVAATIGIGPARPFTPK